MRSATLLLNNTLLVGQYVPKVSIDLLKACLALHSSVITGALMIARHVTVDRLQVLVLAHVALIYEILEVLLLHSLEGFLVYIVLSQNEALARSFLRLSCLSLLCVGNLVRQSTYRLSDLEKLLLLDRLNGKAGEDFFGVFSFDSSRGCIAI